VSRFVTLLGDITQELDRERLADIDLELLKRLKRREIDEKFAECQADVDRFIVVEKARKKI